MGVHQPVVAGTFYPADPAELGAMVEQLLAAAPRHDVPPAEALILPHAGYRFSGAVAAAGVAQAAPGVRRVVILGPSHRLAFSGVALPGGEALVTPLGAMPLDGEAIARITGEPDVVVEPRAFAAEHAIEVELPFLQVRLGAIPIVPLVIGDVATARIAAILDRLWDGPETLVVVSTDLSHFHEAGEATRRDAQTASLVETLSPRGLDGGSACGHRPLAAFLSVAAARGMRLTRLALTHSGAVTGVDDRVVGYGAWMAHGAARARLAPAHRRGLLVAARRALASRVARGRSPKVDVASFATPLGSIAPAFVTLTQDGRLRGCIGSLAAHRPLVEDVVTNALRAGFEDPRFRPIDAQTLNASKIEIAVLSHPAPMAFDGEADLLAQLRPGVDGLILEDGGKRGTFLPKVWETLPTPEQFLTGLKVKAGLTRDHWSRRVRVWRYVTEAFKEP